MLGTAGSRPSFSCRWTPTSRLTPHLPRHSHQAPKPDPVAAYGLASSVVSAIDLLIHAASKNDLLTPELYAWAAPRALSAIEQMFQMFRTASASGGIGIKAITKTSGQTITKLMTEKMPRYAQLAYENSEIVYPEEDHSDYGDLVVL